MLLLFYWVMAIIYFGFSSLYLALAFRGTGIDIGIGISVLLLFLVLMQHATSNLKEAGRFQRPLPPSPEQLLISTATVNFNHVATSKIASSKSKTENYASARCKIAELQLPHSHSVLSVWQIFWFFSDPMDLIEAFHGVPILPKPCRQLALFHKLFKN